MGPIALFDKSFIQAISVDESVWFGHFFYPIICPIFYVETLADLAKTPKSGMPSPETIVERIAHKFPDTSGSPCAFHLNMSLANLLGSRIPMRRGIPLDRGKLVKNDGKSGIVHEVTPENDAFHRWLKGDFHEVERLYAKNWRIQLSNLDLNNTANELQRLGVNTKSCKTHADAKAFAENIIHGKDKIFERMHLVCILLRIPDSYMHEILYRWNSLGNMALNSYAPYAAYVATIELFFHILIASKLESGERNSHLMDMAYLNYLPFCDFFVSQDKLHARCAPLFLRDNQLFIYGTELKEGLKQIDRHFDKFTTEEKEKGITSFAKTPPKEEGFFVSNVWDNYFPEWRFRRTIKEDDLNPKMLDEIKSMVNAKPIPREKIDFDPQNPDTLTIHRLVQKKRGKWYQLPKDFNPKKN
ncbi:TPA: hypothetical protein I8Y91_001617 [Legionella pneumophila]|nr:hypothetical protein [Legionella pneumophila]